MNDIIEFFKMLSVIILPFLSLGVGWLGGTLGLYMARRNKKTGCKTPEFRKKTPPPPIPKLKFAKGGIIEPRPDGPILLGQHAGEREEIIPLSRGENKTPFDDKITEAAQMFIGEGNTAHLPQLYEIEGVDLAEAEPVKWPKENPLLGLSSICGAAVKMGEATAAFKTLSETVHLYAEKEAEKAFAEKETAKVAEEKIVRDRLDAWLYCFENKPRPLFEMLALDFPNKRVVHLARYAKKERTRKKNINRIYNGGA